MLRAYVNVNGLFEINPDNGIVTVMADIDREAMLDIDAAVLLTVKLFQLGYNSSRSWHFSQATESNLDVNGVYASATAILTIQIEDENDNPPLFYTCDEKACTQTDVFSAEVDEHTATGLSITGLNMRVKDRDAGENSRFLLSLEGSAKDLFSVSPTTDMSDRAVQILVKNPTDIDYERNKTLIVQVVAKDAGRPDFVNTATVTIKVNDINDNFPIFAEDVYNLFAPEHCENGLILETITATDADELDNDHLTYKLMPDSLLEIFDVFPKNGTVYVKNGNKLDRERKNSYPATLQARDLAGNVGSTVLEITIKDINDEAPQFFRDKYEYFIRENEVLKAQVEARDDDEPGTPNSQIKYGIEPDNYSDNFTINEDTGFIKSNGPLDREAIDSKLEGKITLNVTATDMGTPPLSSMVNVIIYVEDVNDNTPVFLQSEYTFHVNESERGATVGYVYATDADQTINNNRISFSIKNILFLCVSEPDGEDYRGKVMVDPDAELDFEAVVEYTIIVEATDMGGKTATCTVNIVVEDVNDTPPVFPPGITMKVEENTPAGKEIGKIDGNDKDTNALLVYERVSSLCFYNSTWAPCIEEWFDVKSDGSVITAKDVTIDYEECTQVKMTARVVDLNTQKGMNSTDGVITIDIIDLNDNAPVFIPVQDFFVLIAENTEEGKSVARVLAMDRDSGENQKIEFEVVYVEFVSTNTDEKPQQTDLIFSAETEQPDTENRYGGIIRSKNILQADKEGKYLVTVTAKNVILSTNETLQIITVDKSYKVSLRFDSSIIEVNNNLEDIRYTLAGATKAMVHVVKLTPETSRITQRKVITLLEVYFVFPNGTALNSEAVGKILNSQAVYEEYGYTLQQFGLAGISGNIPVEKTNNTVLFIMVGLVAGLVIVLIVTTTSMVCIRKKYKTKLKAAKAMNTAAMAVDEYQKDGPVVPGTNKYTREGANPVLNLNIDASTDLGFDEEASSADRESLNSLDDNMDMNTADKDTMPMMAIEEEEEENDGDHSYIEPLGAALAQRGKKKGKASESPSITFSNPAFDATTDL
ncbi:cadherin-related family member 2 [Clarias gariepinus]